MHSRLVDHRRCAAALLMALLALPAWAQTSPAEDNAKPSSPTHFGLLRERDLTPFGFLRLDMRPAHAVSGPPGNWGVEASLGYQNTWALSQNVKSYFNSLQGRRAIGPAEIQAIMQRHAAYASVAAVYAQVSDIVPTSGTQVVPTVILGYEYKLTERTNLNAQFYASPSVFKRADTDLDELRKPKYQVSLGGRYRIGASGVTIAVTENVVNYDNSPDIGFQLSWAYSPAFAR